MEHKKALLIAIEGIDGAGKHTLTNGLSQHLRAEGLTVSTIAFPRYGTRFADYSSAALHGRMGDLVDSAYAMALLFALDRCDALNDLQGLVSDSDIVLVDRWVASNAAYSAARLKQSTEESGGIVAWVEALEFGAAPMLYTHAQDDSVRRSPTLLLRSCGLPRADLSVLLDVSVHLARRRAVDRASTDKSRQRDAYERDETLQERTAKAYRELAANNWGGSWWSTDENVDFHSLTQRILQLRDNTRKS